ncbi:unnamed protein product [Ciceribacter selenitireducens ATCC BAA-1503]|uniref:Uncharacterized protein n=1 Tax=Ciceribacter selenitireducens ATCC BAA-1503 TaxID=1336235 RepID=A0A376AEB6_9HYPH|nr:unnamed protein product [Ciceribacter selenitireducens ATCC BAA-1503]
MDGDFFPAAPEQPVFSRQPLTSPVWWWGFFSRASLDTVTSRVASRILCCMLRIIAVLVCVFRIPGHLLTNA